MQVVDQLLQMLEIDRQRSAWSRQQTLISALVKLQGEVGECLEAIEDAGPGGEQALCEELGDVLWSLLFALVVTEEQHGFGLSDVAAGALAKFLHRKAWVLQAGPLLTLEEEEARWLAIKQR